MNKKLKYILALSSVAILMGCGGGGSNPIASILSSTSDKIIGSWTEDNGNNGCVVTNEDNTSEKDIITFSADTIIVDRKEYNNTTCDEADLEKYSIGTFDYDLEKVVKANDGKDAVKMHTVHIGTTYKKGSFDGNNLSTGQEKNGLIRIENGKLYFGRRDANDSNYNYNDFTHPDVYVRVN